VTQTAYPRFYTFVRKIAASTPGSWFLARVLPPLDRLTLQLSGGGATLTGLLAGVPVVMVTTTGAKSGKPRTAPLIPIRDRTDPMTFALIASNWGQHHYPSWYFNLKADPLATCSIGKESGAYMAHEATDAEYERFWGYATDTYLGYAMYKQRAGRRIPIMVMTPRK
jgi:deazaflavin-dependent oxidoreductase (nitroreductase family)